MEKESRKQERRGKRRAGMAPEMLSQWKVNHIIRRRRLLWLAQKKAEADSSWLDVWTDTSGGHSAEDYSGQRSRPLGSRCSLACDWLVAT